MDVLLSEARIQERVGALGRQIEADYQGKPLTIVAVLTGSLIVLADLIRQIHLPLRVALLQANSYRGAVTKAGALALNEAFAPDVNGRDVLLLDDILDTGHTLAALVPLIRARGARSVRTAVLLRKLGRQVVQIEPDYCGFVIPDVFVVGYGLDYNDDYRHLPHVAVLANPDPGVLQNQCSAAAMDESEAAGTAALHQGIPELCNPPESRPLLMDESPEVG